MAKMKNGLYHGVLVKAGVAELETAKATPYMYLTFSIDSKIEMGRDVFLDQNVERDVRFWLSDNAFEYTSKDLARLGFNGDFENPKFDPALYTDGVKLFCGERIDGDKTFEDWSIADLMRAKEKKQASREIIRKLAAKWTAHGGTKFTETPICPPEPAAAGATKDNDEIPF